MFNMSEALTFEAAVEVYRVLIEICGAAPDKDHMASFIFGVMKPWPTTVSFCGPNFNSGAKLGQGGCFVRCGKPWYVFQYQTEITAPKAHIIEAANKRLVVVRAKYPPKG